MQSYVQTLEQTMRAMLAENTSLRAENHALRTSHFGVLAPAATRYELSLIGGPRDVLVLDVRKMHDLNSVLGFTAANALIGELVRVRHADGRLSDVVGQWGGDEFVYATAPSTGRGLLVRLLQQCAALTARLTPAQRQQLSARTNGLIDGVHIAAVLIPRATTILHAVEAGVDATGRLKEGCVTGSRSTSGAHGTRLAVLRLASSGGAL